MKGKIAEFIFTFIIYSIIFLLWNNWNLTSKQIVEMIFIGTLLGLVSALTIRPITRLIENMVRRIFSLKK